uniref:Uncharacterized protein n=1 Tax=Cacopsylla melanoneura TaxID=428564 RepID=A0A8D8Y2N2_9HEMI
MARLFMVRVNGMVVGLVSICCTVVARILSDTCYTFTMRPSSNLRTILSLVLETSPYLVKCAGLETCLPGIARHTTLIMKKPILIIVNSVRLCFPTKEYCKHTLTLSMAQKYTMTLISNVSCVRYVVISCTWDMMSFNHIYEKLMASPMLYLIVTW